MRNGSAASELIDQTVGRPLFVSYDSSYRRDLVSSGPVGPHFAFLHVSGLRLRVYRCVSRACSGD